MDNVAVSRRNHAYKKENKENAQPAYGSKSFIKRGKTCATPFQLKSTKKKETLAKNGPLKAQAKQADTRSKTVQRDGKGATDVKQRQTHSQAFLTEQAVKDKIIVAEAPKPPAAVPSSKSAPGMYKGKIVQSKIGSIWKSSATAGRADVKPSAPETESQRVGNVTKIRSKSVADLPGHHTQKPAQTRSKSVLERPAQVSKPAVTSRPPAGFCSARPPARTVPATLTNTSSRNTNMAPTKGSGTQNSKPKILVTEKKVNKLPVSSTLSQYRFTMETAEERRAKLAEWLASKGKTFKRPAMTTAAPSKTKVSAKPEADLKSQSHVDPQPAKQCDPEPSLEAHKPDSAAHCADTQGAELTIHSQTPVIMNTTLDLLGNSDADLPVDPQDRVDDIVVNLCDVLEAMATPSRCNDELSQMTDVCNDVEVEDSKPKDEYTKELKNETPEHVSEQRKVKQVKDEVEESDDQEVETDVEEGESDDDEEVGVMETTSQMKDASVVKYSVKTTPYLQSVKKTIEDDASTSTSRRKSNIKDLKFLTPVRRSCRIERKSSRLPTMLVDHDLCVSSLAELVKLDDDPNAYIYRKNPALLEDLPDQPRL
ncbi:cytoskeleton-associated protein 2 [Siniperca chuatsi]|uniref:cytoskeleton-associated protein 2 n=1 Tax=Siniperca chuatsi TaxID=119488 RepID=UPI001CE0B4E3|nr:cytoskeleton-associated protein 2 [Siniperca chuatsi]XP_044079208.1 cytoskeleton-associated protein 2 [Siniperca chuatsi]